MSADNFGEAYFVRTTVILNLLLSFSFFGFPAISLACPGVHAETYVFFESRPEAVEKENFIGEVQVRDFNEGTDPPYVVRVITSDTHTELVGKDLVMRYVLTSCGPYLSPQNGTDNETGERGQVTRGFVVGRLEGDTLIPFYHSLGSVKPKVNR